MAILYTGLAIFIGVHLFTGFARGPRAALIGKLGDGGYKGIYSLVSLAGFILIIIGWRQGSTDPVYTPPEWGPGAAVILMALSFILFTAAYLPAGRIKSFVGHPMVVGTILFAAAHLLTNGDLRSGVLFGALLGWSLLDRIAVKMRGDLGPKGSSLVGDGLSIAAGLFSTYLVAHHLHRYIAGVGLDPAHFFGG
ncbi:NnrU family protein [Parvularcula sp. ZS-1/3]|uniref:NnrU family protein n=1 Tax=Parvularcula mediterranea TaxID=2732508 RepID=A0A7Y3RK18_9PROT|nr:NnrU family protein [Parvularcula mediterranea]NNU15509.1 NnrU family protein [Parvularcula mediterranea]